MKAEGGGRVEFDALEHAFWCVGSAVFLFTRFGSASMRAIRDLSGQAEYWFPH
jgi:hypothetical protein